MKIKIRNKIINESVENMIYQLRRELTNGKLKDVDATKGSDILVTCPNVEHKGGFERHPSCRVFSRTDDDKTEAGTTHCFACGYTASFPQFVADCLDVDLATGEEWLVERFGNVFLQQEEYLPEIVLDKQPVKKTYLDESVLTEYDYYHPYMWQRKLSKEVVDRFRVGYDPSRDAITFPVYDEKHNLVMVTARSVKTKRFWIPAGIQKPIYLLDYVIKSNITKVIVTEGQLDALTAWSYGFPAVATMGCPSDEHIKLLNSCGLREIITMFDNDAAGENFAKRLKKHIRDDIFLLHAKLPDNTKDINDLTKEQFDTVINNLM